MIPKYMKIAFVFMMFIGILTFSIIPVNAEVQSLGVYKQNDCIILKQICSNCTYNNITSIISPNGVQIVNQVAMTKVGTDFNYSFCSTNVIGDYIVNGKGDLDGQVTAWSYSFTITPTGDSSMLGFYFIILILPWGLFVLGLWKKDITFAVLGTIGFYFIAFYFMIYGIDGRRDMITNALGVIHLGVAFYTSIRYTWESLMEGG